jgi:hypothetical protein
MVIEDDVDGDPGCEREERAKRSLAEEGGEEGHCGRQLEEKVGGNQASRVANWRKCIMKQMPRRDECTGHSTRLEVLTDLRTCSSSQ